MCPAQTGRPSGPTSENPEQTAAQTLSANRHETPCISFYTAASQGVDVCTCYTLTALQSRGLIGGCQCNSTRTECYYQSNFPFLSPTLIFFQSTTEILHRREKYIDISKIQTKPFLQILKAVPMMDTEQQAQEVQPHFLIKPWKTVLQ